MTNTKRYITASIYAVTLASWLLGMHLVQRHAADIIKPPVMFSLQTGDLNPSQSLPTS